MMIHRSPVLSGFILCIAICSGCNSYSGKRGDSILYTAHCSDAFSHAVAFPATFVSNHHRSSWYTEGLKPGEYRVFIELPADMSGDDLKKFMAQVSIFDVTTSDKRLIASGGGSLHSDWRDASVHSRLGNPQAKWRYPSSKNVSMGMTVSSTRQKFQIEFEASSYVSTQAQIYLFMFPPITWL